MKNNTIAKLTMMSCLFHISVTNAVRKVAVQKHADGDFEFTAGEMYSVIDKNTLKEWARLCEGSDYEVRAKFILKELRDIGLLGEADGRYTATVAMLEDYENSVLEQLLSSFLTIEFGIDAQGNIDKDNFSAFSEEDTPCFLSFDDLEAACKLFVRNRDLPALLG